MPESHIEKIARIIDFASFYSGANSEKDMAGRRLARQRANEIMEYLEKAGALK